MAIFRNRFPAQRDVVLLFASCVVPVYSWTVLFFFRRMQGWLLYLRPWEMMGILAYALLSAFLESVVFLLVWILLSVILPTQLFQHRFVAQGSAMMLLTSLFAIVLQYKPAIIASPGTSLLAAVLYLVFNGVACALLRRYGHLEESLRALVERLTVLLYIYVAATLVSIIVIVIRNI